MTDKLFDNFIHDKLHNHSTPVSEGMWARIEEELKEDKEERKVFLFRRWYWAAAILVLTLSSAAWLYMSASHTSEVTVATPSASNAASSSTFKGSTATGGTAINAGDADKIVSNDHSSTVSNHVPANSDNNTSGTAAQPNQPTVYNNTDASHNASANIDNSEEKPAKATHNRLFQRRKPVTNPTDEESNTLYNAYQANKQVSATQEATAFERFGTLPSAIAVINNQQADYRTALQHNLEAQENKFTPIIRCPSVRNPVPNDLYIEAYASPDMVFRSTSANNGASNYMVNRDSSLSLRTSFTAGVRISKALTENLLIKTGLQYSQINEDYKYKQENERKQVTVITTHTITDANGQTITVRDTSSYEQIGYLQRNIKNRYRSIDIPVILSYEWGNNNWRFATNGGAIINLRSWYSGEIPDTLNQPVKNGSGIYRNNIGIGLYAGFSIIKSINENTDLFAEPYFRYNLSDMTQKGQAFNQKFNTAGLSLGIRYRINGGQRY
ncbi:hypothetical protein SAMN05421788_11430 [Filimonas lacunae]|uniref:Outer membrane protein beta-barrel domain-containing protein n=1 Tax=Filimonas lacunae TaxID=477680 RepID=A0A173MLT6_9BACT|nr:hypothetical protein [Filimonas lacunae]BAV08447.1 hypothetical protein FLA_4488 [Filimonas lacunae]SIT33947.1 hypothetical protein SAMN05421788_11430 [Filimonas lacunae]